MSNAWDGPEGEKVRKVLEDAGLVDWQNDACKMRLTRSRFGVWKVQTPNGRSPTGWVRVRSPAPHEAHCILRDAARVFLDLHGLWLGFALNLCDGHDYDAALIAAVLAVGKEKHNA